MGFVIPFTTIICVILATCHADNRTISIRHKYKVTAIKKTTTLKDFGDLTLKIVEAMLGDEEAKVVDLGRVTKLVSALSRAAVFVDNPQEMYQIEMDSMVGDVIQRLDKLESDYKKQHKVQTKCNGKSPIEFLAYFTPSEQTVRTGSIVKFDNVVKSGGAATLEQYDPQFGYFTCPCSGHYFISLQFRGSTHSYDDHYDDPLKLKVLLGSETLWRSYSNSKYITVSGSRIAHCKQGERIWVESESGGLIYGSVGFDTMLYIYLI